MFLLFHPKTKEFFVVDSWEELPTMQEIVIVKGTCNGKEDMELISKVRELVG
jgi:hypothetical protein